MVMKPNQYANDPDVWTAGHVAMCYGQFKDMPSDQATQVQKYKFFGPADYVWISDFIQGGMWGVGVTYKGNSQSFADALASSPEVFGVLYDVYQFKP